LHRLIYISALAAVIHYYWLVKSDIRLPALYGAILMLLLTARMFRSRTSRSRKTTGLRLLSIKRQTKDTVSLRFLLSGSQRLSARPGQFLTFDWIVGSAQEFGRRAEIAEFRLNSQFADGQRVH
jgi:hypothetical protein